MTTTIQIPWLILPRVWTFGTETEAIADILEHTSVEFPCEYIQEKEVYILAVEAVAAGMPGTLLAWVELSPVPSTVSPNYWAAIGGGGGFLPPTSPAWIEPGTGVNLAYHATLVAWSIHSNWARIIIQTPVLVPTAIWGVQCIISGKK